MRRSYLFLLLLLAIAFSSNSCHVNDKSEVTLDDCDGDLLHAKDSTTLSLAGSNDASWGTQTPKAAGSCTTVYHVWFRWVSDESAENDPNPPPVTLLFTPGISENAKPQKFSGHPAGFGTLSNKGWWLVTLAPSPTSESGNTTAFNILAILNKGANEDVDVYTDILYRHSPN